MYAPIFLLTFVWVAFICKPEDKSSSTDAHSDGKYSHHRQREPINQVETEGVVLEVMHKNRFSHHQICRAGSFDL